MIKAVLLLVLTLAAPTPAHAADRFVAITDSHGVGRFGEKLIDWLEHRPATAFEFFASGGSAPLQWLNNALYTTRGFHTGSAHPAGPLRAIDQRTASIVTPSLARLWERQGPRAADERRVSLIFLGTNLTVQPSFRASHLAELQRLLDVADRESDRCLWIGPPRMRTGPEFDAAGVAYKIGLIQKAIAAHAERTGRPPCQFIDSRELSTYPAGSRDGVHYHAAGPADPVGSEAAERWAAAVIDQVERRLAE